VSRLAYSNHRWVHLNPIIFADVSAPVDGREESDVPMAVSTSASTVNGAHGHAHGNDTGCNNNNNNININDNICQDDVLLTEAGTVVAIDADGDTAGGGGGGGGAVTHAGGAGSRSPSSASSRTSLPGWVRRATHAIKTIWRWIARFAFI